MQRLYGTPLDNPEAPAAQGITGELPLRRGIKAWLEAAILHGPFHGDAHAGNLWILATAGSPTWTSASWASWSLGGASCCGTSCTR